MLKELINIEQKKGTAFTIEVVKRDTSDFGPIESFMVSNPAIFLLKSGSFTIQVGEIVQDLQVHDLLIFPKKSFCTEKGYSDKLQFFLIRFLPIQAGQSSGYGWKDPLLDLVLKQPLKISLEQNDYLVLSMICRLLYASGKNTMPLDFEMELQRAGYHLLLFELKYIYAKYVTASALHFSRAESLTMQFLTVVSIHCRKHHTVKFYAGALYVTSGYLNRVVKHVTGKPAKKIIAEAVLAQAIQLLEDPHFTISGITEELEFSSPSAFDIFFKKLMSCSPSEYRSNAVERFKGC